MKKVKLLCFLAALMALGIFSCSDEDPEPGGKNTDPVIDEADDPDDVPESLTFENAKVTVVKEAFPASSGEAGAPVLVRNEENENLPGISGGKLSLNFDESTGADIKGVYVQIDGTDHYFDVVFNTISTSSKIFTGGQRTFRNMISSRIHGAGSLLLTLPKDLEGNFCFTYAVYDHQNRASNPIEICVEVKMRGGENSSFLTANVWSMELEYWTETDSSETYTDTTVVGKVYEDPYTYSYSCPGDTAMHELILTDTYTLDYVHLNFSTDGTVTLEESESGKQANADAICETGLVERVDESEVFTSTGTWSYNDVKKEVTIITEQVVPSGAAIEESGNMDLEVYQVKKENGKLILTSDLKNEQSVSIFQARN